VFADEPDPFSNSSRNGRGPIRERRDLTSIDVTIETGRPRIELRMRADKDILPIVRQTLRALAQSIGAQPEALQDAELAVTEAVANAVRHAYGHGDGRVDVSIEARPDELLVVVRDEGKGMRDPWHDKGRRRGGLGLTVIQSVACDVEIRSKRGVGTEVVMALPGPDGDLSEENGEGGSTVEQVTRRLVAMASAQSDLPPARITEALLAAELIARHALGRVAGDTVHVRLDRLPTGIELKVGPLEVDGTAALLEDARVPVLGSIIERFADDVRAVPPDRARPGDGEQLAASFLA
jgi:anti-sigma regulatory factor (Ser/Thr protein kinase)